jgi:hypothetical protein
MLGAEVDDGENDDRHDDVDHRAVSTAGGLVHSVFVGHFVSWKHIGRRRADLSAFEYDTPTPDGAVG